MKPNPKLLEALKFLEMGFPNLINGLEAKALVKYIKELEDTEKDLRETLSELSDTKNMMRNKCHECLVNVYEECALIALDFDNDQVAYAIREKKPK